MRSLINYINYNKNIGEHYENKKCHRSSAYKNVRVQLNTTLNLVTKTVRKKQVVFALLYPSFQQVFSCSNTGSIRDDPYWTSKKNSLELIELSSINKVSLV